MHDDFDIDVTIKGFVEPILGILKGQRSPHLGILWVNPHLPGLLKPINARLQQRSHTLAYSSHMTKFFEDLCIPVFETKHFTNNVFSVDGTHYGYGVNSLKARILINYLNQISHGGHRWWGGVQNLVRTSGGKIYLTPWYSLRMDTFKNETIPGLPYSQRQVKIFKMAEDQVKVSVPALHGR